MSARDYAVTFPYGATSAPYSASSPHRGNDRPCPTGTPVIIGDTTIGYTGSTGWAIGAHLHTQAGSDLWCQQTFNPSGLEFQPGTVRAKGWADQWGNYVIVQTSGGYICYAHLSSTNATVGQVINGSTTGGTSVETVKSMYWRLLGREADQGGIDTYTARAGDRGWEFVYTELKNSPEGQRDWDRRNPTRVANLEAQAAQLATVQAQLQELKNKPPEVVIKEVEKIVTKEIPVEVVKEVPVYVNDEETRKTVVSIKMMLVNFIGWVKSKLGR